MTKIYSLDILKISFEGSFKNKTELLQYKNCGCFYCLNLLKVEEITEWVNESDNTETAVCPKCGIDSILSEKYPIFEKIFMEEMQNYWF